MSMDNILDSKKVLVVASLTGIFSLFAMKVEEDMCKKYFAKPDNSFIRVIADSEQLNGSLHGAINTGLPSIVPFRNTTCSMNLAVR